MTHRPANYASIIWRIHFVVSAALVLLVENSVADDDIAFDASVTLTSDSIYRGISQTLSKPALQLGLSAEHDNGWFAWVWASNLDYMKDPDPDDGARVEINYSVGYRHAISSDLEIELSVLNFVVPQTYAAIDYDFVEWTTALTLHERHRIEVSYSDAAWGSDELSLHYLASTTWPLFEPVNLTVQFGYYDLERAEGDTYDYGRLALSSEGDRFGWDLSYYRTSATDDEIFYRSTTEPRLVVGVDFYF